MKNKFLSGLSVLIVWATASCSQSSDDGKNGGTPEWNRSRTATVYAAGAFDNRASLTGDGAVDRVVSAWTGAGFRIGWLQGYDVVYEEPVKNPVVTAARRLQCIPVFAASERSADVYRGDGLLLRHSLTRQDETEIAPDCFLKTVETFADAARNLPMTLGTVRLQTETHIRLAQKPLADAASKGVLVIGSIRKTLLPAWEAAWQPASASIRRTVIDPGSGATQAFFVLNSPAWLVRDSDVDPDGTLVFIRLQIERL